MKRIAERVLAVMMAAAMTVSLAACGGKGGQNPNDNSGETQKKEFVWVPEFFEPDTEQRLYSVKVYDQYLYFENYEWDEAAQRSNVSIDSISAMDGSAGPSIPLNRQSEEEEENRSLSSFMFDGEGNLVTVETIYHWNEETGDGSQEFFLCKYNAQGEFQSEIDFTDMLKDAGDSYIQYADIDGEGRIYLCSSSVVYLLDAEGQPSGSISLGTDTWVRGMGAGKDGKMYITLYDMGSNGVVLKELDFEGKKLGASYSNFINGNSNNRLVTGVEKDFMDSDGTALYEYDIATQTAEKLFDWLDCDIDGSQINALYAMEDGRILVCTYDWEQEDGRAEMALLTKTPAAQVKEKVNITIGALYSDYTVRAAAVKFNKSNASYHISLENYFDYNDVTFSGDESNYAEVMADAITRMNNDITSGNCPDMLILNGLNVAQLAEKGVFEDLGTYLDGSSALSRSDYFENILEAYTYDGKLVAIPRDFELTTLVGKASDLGTEAGWTLEEMMAYGNEHPDAELLANASKETALETMLRYTLSNFVNWEAGECDFNDDAFASLLEFANKFPEKYEYDEDAPAYPTRIAAGEILLDTLYIYDFNSIQMPEAMFGEPVTYIGYPNKNGDSGTYLQLSSGLAITSKCSDKEGAWAFMEYYLNMPRSLYSNGFSSRKSEFEEARAKATTIEYLYEYEYNEDGGIVLDDEGNPKYKLDEDGNPVIRLDEEGNPMTANSGGSIGYGNDWTYTYHVTTEEEADKIEELIKSAKPATDSDLQILNIVKEEAQAFFKGQKSAKDVAGVIQSRVQLYVNENR